MSFKTLLVLGAALVPASAVAQESPWPAPLKHRNARYALRERAQDEAGDAKEAVLRDLVLYRALDSVGDREELRRAEAGRKTPPRATVYAQVTPRALDPRDDAEQVFVAKLPSKERRHAELRRFRDLAGDQRELAAFRRDLIRFGPLWGEPVMHAEDGLDRGADRFFDDRGDAIRRDDHGTESEQDVERRRDRDEERRDERDTAERRADADAERRADADADRAEKDLERDAERDADKAEKDEDRDADKDADKLDKDAERDLERKLDKGDLDTDRDTERQIQREDEKNGLDD